MSRYFIGLENSQLTWETGTVGRPLEQHGENKTY